VQFGRRAVLVALGERVLRGIDRLGRVDVELGPRALRALAGDDRAQPAEGVDADLRDRSRPRRPAQLLA
jgi:hypothetical protein